MVNGLVQRTLHNNTDIDKPRNNNEQNNYVGTRITEMNTKIPTSKLAFSLINNSSSSVKSLIGSERPQLIATVIASGCSFFNFCSKAATLE